MLPFMSKTVVPWTCFVVFAAYRIPFSREKRDPSLPFKTNNITIIISFTQDTNADQATMKQKQNQHHGAEAKISRETE